jgi:uncharacterized membrane protein YeaQ/YmgE (transglycosylase-associated protein family)
MLSLLWEALIGLMVGAVAKFVMPGKDPGGIIVTMILGILGAFVATYLGQMVGWYKQGDAAGFIMSVVGAVLLLAIYRLPKGKRPRLRPICKSAIYLLKAPRFLRTTSIRRLALRNPIHHGYFSNGPSR